MTGKDKENNNKQAKIMKEGNYGQNLQGTVFKSRF